MKKILIIIIAMILGYNSYSQNIEPVYLYNNKFYDGCNEFYPKASNYQIDIILDWGTQNFYVSPRQSYYSPTCTNCKPYGDSTACIAMGSQIDDCRLFVVSFLSAVWRN